MLMKQKNSMLQLSYKCFMKGMSLLLTALLHPHAAS